MDITKSSPYAAPNTPIASSKRPRIASKALKSPSLQQTRLYATSTPDRHSAATEAKEYNHKAHHRNNIHNNSTAVSTGSTVPATPSKNLFSPGLRTDAPNQHKKHDENVELNVSSVSYSSDEEDGPDDVAAPVIETPSKKEEASSTTPATTAAATATATVEEEEDEEVFNPYSFIAGLPRHSTVKVKGKVCLPPAKTTDKITLVLDLDETLVHCTVEPIPNPDLVFPVAFNGTVYQVYVRKRPYLDYFLETVAKTFEVVVFTASQKVYADVLLDQIDPGKKFIDHRLFREACLLVQGNYLKDLEVLGRNNNKTVLVDNSPHAYGYQIDQGIPIESWYDDDTDTELLKLIGFLRRLTEVEDVKPIVREKFKTYQLIANAKAGLPPVLTAPPF